MIKSQSHLPRLLRLVRIEQAMVEVGCCTAVCIVPTRFVNVGTLLTT